MNDNNSLKPGTPDPNSLLDLFEEPSFIEKWKRVFAGLSQPRGSGKYKWAKLQVVRLNAPAAAVVVPLLLLLLLSIIAITPEKKAYTGSITIMEEPDKREREPEPEPVKPVTQEKIETETQDMERFGDRLLQDFPFSDTGPEKELSSSPEPTVNAPVQLIAAPVKSPVKVPGIYSIRFGPKNDGSTPGTGGPDGPGVGSPEGNTAVLRALRWLKKNQEQDGSWGKVKPAMTSLAVLTYLGYGQTTDSDEFGDTVRMALEWLLANQKDDGRFNGSDAHEYSLPIAAYALSEAYGLTRVTDLKYAAEKAVEIIIRGQHRNGGWNYNCNQDDRDDTSYMGWCIQALKAAQISGLENKGLDEACRLSVNGLRKNFAGSYEKGGFGYTAPSLSHGLTGVGVLCMQLMDRRDSDEVAGGLASLDKDSFKMDLLNPWDNNALYYWYYITQAKFHAGGAAWNKWNAVFWKNLVATQHRISKKDSGYTDHAGMPQETGFWDQYSGHGSDNNPVFPTVLCALQLEVYYRYLPSYGKIHETELSSEKDKNRSKPAGPPPETRNAEKDRALRIDINFFQI